MGIETLLVRAGDGPVMQVPLTYRNDRLEGGDPWLLGTMERSALDGRTTPSVIPSTEPTTLAVATSR